MSFKLWHSPASPFVRKVMVFAHETGQADAIELVPGDVWEPGTQITRDNPLRKVPALATPDGVFAGSYLCCEYLDTLHAGPRLIPGEGPGRWPVLQLHAFADGMMEATVAAVTEKLRRPKEYVYQGNLDRQDGKIRDTLDRIGTMTLDQSVNIATVTLGCALGYLDFRAPHLAWREGRKALSLWYETFSARKSMQATLPHV